MAETQHFQDQMCSTPVTINSGAALSNVVDLGGTTLTGLVLPAVLTNTTINFRAAHDTAANVLPLFDSFGVRIGATVGTSRIVALDPTVFAGLRFIQLEGATNEAATATIGLASRPV